MKNQAADVQTDMELVPSNNVDNAVGGTVFINCNVSKGIIGVKNTAK